MSLFRNPFRPLSGHRQLHRRLSFVLLALIFGAGTSSAQEDEPLRFTYSMHSTLGLLRMEATVEATGEAVGTNTFRVPNRGFSEIQSYRGDGSFAYRLLGEEDGPKWPSVSLQAPRSWNGRHLYFFAFRNPGGEVPIRLAPLPENPEFRGRGAIVFGNYASVPIAAKLGEATVRTLPGKTLWRAAPDAPEGMETLLVKAEDDRLRPIYRNRIPIRENERLFIFIVPGPRERGEQLIVIYDRSPLDR